VYRNCSSKRASLVSFSSNAGHRTLQAGVGSGFATTPQSSEKTGEQVQFGCNLGYLESDVASMNSDLRANLDRASSLVRRIQSRQPVSIVFDGLSLARKTVANGAGGNPSVIIVINGPTVPFRAR
jgi:hypothetical protein